jgi:hypothetical protein
LRCRGLRFALDACLRIWRIIIRYRHHTVRPCNPEWRQTSVICSRLLCSACPGEPPAVSFVPASVQFSVSAQSRGVPSLSQSFQLHNSGGVSVVVSNVSVVRITCECIGGGVPSAVRMCLQNVPWMEASPISFSTIPLTSTTITVSVHPSFLPSDPSSYPLFAVRHCRGCRLVVHVDVCIHGCCLHRL